MKKVIIFAGLILVVILATGGASASEASFWEEYTASYLEKFGEDRFRNATEPVTWKSYPTDYVRKFGQDRYDLANKPINGLFSHLA